MVIVVERKRHMKILAVYYSRTGVTRTVAEALAGRLRAEIEEIRDRKTRNGILGGLGGGKDAVLKRLTEIDPPNQDPSGYDLVLIGTPVWAGTMAPAVRTYLSQYTERLGNVALFCTMGSSGDRRTFRHMAELIGTQPKATLALREKTVRSDAFVAEANDFADRLAASG